MSMAPYTMDIPWAGTVQASIKVVNDRILEAIEEYAKANKISKINAVVSFKGIMNIDSKTFVRYRIETQKRS